MIIGTIEPQQTSQKIERRALNTYTKGPLFCVMLEDRTVEKYPLKTIFRITEQAA